MKNLKRDPEKVLTFLEESGDMLIAKKDMIFQVPVRYSKKELCIIGDTNYAYGIAAIIIPELQIYAVLNVDAMLQLKPAYIDQTKIDGNEYYNFHIEKNAPLFVNLNVVKQDTLMYNLFYEFFTKANIPWYIEDKNDGNEDLSKIFTTSGQYANSRVYEHQALMEVIASIVARDTDDRMLFYRHLFKDGQAPHTPAAYIGLSDVNLLTSDTISRLGGNYFGDAVVSSLVNPSERSSPLEELIRK